MKKIQEASSILRVFFPSQSHLIFIHSYKPVYLFLASCRLVVLESVLLYSLEEKKGTMWQIKFYSSSIICTFFRDLVESFEVSKESFFLLIKEVRRNRFV